MLTPTAQRNGGTENVSCPSRAVQIGRNETGIPTPGSVAPEPGLSPTAPRSRSRMPARDPVGTQLTHAQVHVKPRPRWRTHVPLTLRGGSSHRREVHRAWSRRPGRPRPACSRMLFEHIRAGLRRKRATPSSPPKGRRVQAHARCPVSAGVYTCTWARCS